MKYLKITKKGVIRIIDKIFDLLSLILSFTIRDKILLQDICKKKHWKGLGKNVSGLVSRIVCRCTRHLFRHFTD